MISSVHARRPQRHLLTISTLAMLVAAAPSINTQSPAAEAGSRANQAESAELSAAIAVAAEPQAPSEQAVDSPSAAELEVPAPPAEVQVTPPPGEVEIEAAPGEVEVAGPPVEVEVEAAPAEVEVEVVVPVPPVVPPLDVRLWHGEYEGTAGVAGGSLRAAQQVGLQVAALGEGRFFGVVYPGGLPGTGWSGDSRYRLEGAIDSAGVLRLAGEGLRIAVAEGRARVTTEDALVLGSLERVFRHSATLGMEPPPGAVMIFDGSDTGQLVNPRITADGLLQVGTQFRQKYQDFKLHLEFMLPLMPDESSQGRGNSGVYLQSRYEVQILDSFGLKGAFNECGALYRLKEPRVNMCLPPQQWQTYDIYFRSPRYNDAGEKIADARITLWHNNIRVHDRADVPRKTGAGAAEGPELLPIKLQDHGDPVLFRNIWLVDQTPREPAALRNGGGRNVWYEASAGGCW